MKVTSFSSTDYHETKESYDAGKHGKDYEVEMSKFLFKRLLDMNYKNFKFTREKKGLGKFDDLAFVYENEKGHWYSLVQLKHILNLSRKIDYDSLAAEHQSYFYLPKYFVYYQELLNFTNQEKNFQEAELKHLIICTNIGFERNLRDIEKINMERSCKLFHDSGCLHKLLISHDVKRKIFTDCFISDGEKLAKELCSCFFFSNPIDLNNLICNESASMILKFHVALNNEVIDVSKNCFKSEFLASDLEEKSYIYSFRKSIISYLDEIYSKCRYMNESEIKNYFFLSIKKAANLKMLISHYNVKDPLEFLRNMKFIIKKSFLDLSLTPNSMQSLSELKEVNFDYIDYQIDIFLDKLLFATEQNKNESLIREELLTDLYLAYSDKINNWYYTGSKIDEIEAYRKREWLSKDKIISDAMNYVANFQNRRIYINQIIDDKSLLNSEVLIKVFSSFPVNIGNNFETNNKMEICYIPRLLTRQRCIQKSYLKESNIDIIILSEATNCLNLEDIQRLIHDEEVLYSISNFSTNSVFILADEHFGEADFDKIIYKHRKNFECKNVHWLEICNDNIFWKKTYGSLNTLHNYVIENEDLEDIVNEAEIFCFNGVIIIVGEPGMGKSTFVDHVMKSAKESSCLRWVIKVSLKNILSYLQSSQNFKDVEQILAFLAECEFIKDNFSYKLMKNCMLTKKVILIFDGFDELRTNIQMKNFIHIINRIQSNFQVKQIWITTRPNRKTYLENNLGVISFSLKEITSEQQSFFITEYWIHHTKKPRHLISHYSNNLINTLNYNLTFHEKQFLGIPLQTYMFATVFLQDILEESPNLNKKLEYLQLSSLFNRFIQSKYDLFFEKVGIACMPSDIKKILVKFFDEVHQTFVIRHEMFQSINIQKLNTKQYNIEDERLLEIGIIYKSKNTYHFIHQTFAEYLLAKRLTNMVLNNENEIFCVKETLLELIAMKEHKFILFLFDDEITETSLQHKYVLHGQHEKLAHLSNKDINTEDCLGRNLFYYAFQYRQFDILNLLLKKKASINCDDPYLMKAIETYLEYSYKNDIGSLKFTDDIFSKIFDYDVNIAMKISNFIDMEKEIIRKNWNITEKVLKISQETKKFNNNIYNLGKAMRYDAPFHLIERILSCIQMNKDKLEDKIFPYSNFMKYVLECNIENVEKLIHLFIDSFKNKAPLLIGVFEYFDLKNVEFGESFSSLVDILEKRSNHFLLIVKLLLENGAFYVKVRNNDVDDIFSESRFNPRLLKLPIQQFLEKIYKREYKYFKLAFSEFSKYNANSLSVNISLVLNNIRKNEDKINLEPSDTLEEAVVKLCTNILRSSRAKDLLCLTSKFHEAILENNYQIVKKCIKEAKENMWYKALVSSIDKNMKKPVEVAKEYLHIRIYLLLKLSRQ